MSVSYNPDASASYYKDYYSRQASGTIIQSGGSLPVFHGSTRQQGYGLGNIFAKVFSSLKPMLSNVAKSAGKQLIHSGAQLATDMIDGDSFSNSARKNLSSGGRQLVNTLTTRLQGGRRRGGVKRKINNNNKTKGVKTKRPRVNRDIFR